MSTQAQRCRSLCRVAADIRLCRQWLQDTGLRCGMPRLKVLETLCYADDEAGVSSRELYRQLREAGEPL